MTEIEGKQFLKQKIKEVQSYLSFDSLNILRNF
jgi:hypothetical protein